MSDRLQTSGPATSMDIPNATSSPALAGGATPCGLPVGVTRDLFGLEAVLVNPSAPPAKAAVAPTTGTYGRIGDVSSASASLQQSLASRLRQRLDGAGSTLFAQTWRRRVTPRGRPYWEHTASARRTSGSDCGSWRSPQATDGTNGGPNARDSGGNPHLSMQAEMASWPTPTVQDDNRDRMSAEARAKEMAREGRGINGSLVLASHLASWPTPVSSISPPAPWKDGEPWWLQSRAARNIEALASWATPTVDDSFNVTRASGQYQSLTRQAQALGPTSSGSPAQTEKRGQLNARFSGWLQGYPIAWDMCAPGMVTPYRRSSKAGKAE
jgi:hypothetical protein